MIKRSLEDIIIEPYRGQLIPYYGEVKSEALNAGALGAGISGSGPSIFMLTEGLETAKHVEQAIRSLYSKTQIHFETYVSKINTEGIKTL